MNSPANSLNVRDVVKTVNDLVMWYSPILAADFATSGTVTWKSVLGAIFSATMTLIRRYLQGDAQAVSTVQSLKDDFSHLNSENE